MEISFNQNITQTLQLHLSPRLLNMLRVLNLPYVEMVAEIEQASEENPFVEIEKHDSLTEYIRYLDSGKKARKDVDFKEYPGLENIKNSKKNLKDFLLEQLSLVEIEENLIEIIKAIIDEIDENGYIKNYDDVKKSIIEEQQASEADIDKALELVQTFEPEGVGARNIKECLLIQIREFGFENEKLRTVIESAVQNHLEAMAKNDLKKVAEALAIGEDGVHYIMDFIKKNLNPHPTSNFSHEEQHVIPSFSVEIKEGQLKAVNLEEAYGPKVVISKEYKKMLQDPKTDAETVKFLKEKLEKAKGLLEDLKKRGDTSQAIMDIVIKIQRGFFEKGAAYLFPLEQKYLAEELGLHPSTISRAVANKYVQTEKGLIPLKFLCQREFKGTSPAAIKTKILEMINKEDKNDPLNDETIKDALIREGIKIERRTVSAYRKQLGLDSSENRINK